MKKERVKISSAKKATAVGLDSRYRKRERRGARRPPSRGEEQKEGLWKAKRGGKKCVSSIWEKGSVDYPERSGLLRKARKRRGERSHR